MLLKYNVMQYIGQIYRAGKTITGCPLYWNKECERMEFKRYYFNQFVWLFLCLLLTAANAYQTVKYQSEHNIAHMSMGLFGVIGFAISSYYVWNVPKSAKGICQFFNGIVQIERNTYSSANTATISKAMLTFIRGISAIFAASGIACPLLLALGSLILSDTPVNCLDTLQICKLIYCTKYFTGQYKLVLMGFTFLVNFACWQVLCIYGSLGACHILLGSCCLEEAINLFNQIILKRSNGYTGMLLHRQIQLAVKIFNESHVGIIVSTLLVSSLSMSALMYTLLKCLTTDIEMPLPMKGCYTVFAFNCGVIILGAYGFAARVYSTSTEVQRSLRSNVRLMMDIRIKRCLASCPILSVKFGVTNFIESRTPLMFFDFTMARFVDLVLLDAKGRH